VGKRVGVGDVVPHTRPGRCTRQAPQKRSVLWLTAGANRPHPKGAGVRSPWSVGPPPASPQGSLLAWSCRCRGSQAPVPRPSWAHGGRIVKRRLCADCGVDTAPGTNRRGAWEHYLVLDTVAGMLHDDGYLCVGCRGPTRSGAFGWTRAVGKLVGVGRRSAALPGQGSALDKLCKTPQPSP
jgi:hypothetical protein